MLIAAAIVYYAIAVYIFILACRVVFDWISFFARDWRPRGVVLVIANFVYMLTDPPVRFFGRIIPPLRLGGVSLDMGFLIFFILLIVAQRAVLWVFASLLV